MSISNGVVSTPIKLSEIATLLGVDSKLSAVASLESEKTVKFNKWSKYKPVHTYGVLTEKRTEKTPLTKGGNYWWKGERGNCDWLYQDTTQLSTAITNSEKVWSFLYDSAFSNLDRPYRLGDFTGYSHYALPPIKASSMTTKQVYMSDKSVTLSAIQPSDHNGGLTFADFGFDDMYMAAIWLESENNPRIRTGGKVNTNKWSITIPVTSFPQPTPGNPKTYIVYGAIAHKEETYDYNGGNKIGNHYINLPEVVKNTVTLYNKADWWGYTTTVKGVMNANGTLSYNVEGKASGESGEDVTITVNKLVVWPTNSHSGSTYKNITPASSERTFVVKYGAKSTLFSSDKTVSVDLNVYKNPTVEYQFKATYSGYSETQTKYISIVRPMIPSL